MGEFRRELQSTGGDYQHEKAKFMFNGPVDHPQYLAAMQIHAQHNTGVKPQAMSAAGGGVKFCGAFIGTDNYVAQETLERAKRTQGPLYQQLREVPLRARTSMALLRICVWPMGMFAARVTRPDLFKQTAEYIDQEVRAALLRTTGISERELTPNTPKSRMALQQLGLPLRFGGFGCLRYQEFQHLAYYSSLATACALGALAEMLPCGNPRAFAPLDEVLRGVHDNLMPFTKTIRLVPDEFSGLSTMHSFYRSIHVAQQQRRPPKRGPDHKLQRILLQEHYRALSKEMRDLGSQRDKARWRNVSHKLFTLLPFDSHMEVDERAWLYNCRMRVGLPPAENMVLLDFCDCSDPDRHRPEHALNCIQLKRRALTRRHNFILDAKLYCSRMGGIPASKEVSRLAENNERLTPDLILWSLKELIDLVVVYSCAPSHRDLAARVQGHAASEAERAKESKYNELAEACGLTVRGFGVDALGQFGPGATATIDKLVKEAAASPLCPFSAAEFKRLLVGSILAALAVGNADAIDQAQRATHSKHIGRRRFEARNARRRRSR
jgi:hypothetical protein